MTTNFAGIYPPIIIPFKDDEEIYYDKLESNIRKWNTQPMEGIVVPGSNSEAVHLSREERIQIWKFCAPLLNESKKRFIAGVGADATADAIELVLIAGGLGADAILMLPPYFYKQAITHDILVSHFWAVADESPVPILLYNVPAFTGIDFLPNTLIKLAEHPKIIGYKDSSTNVVKAASVLARRDHFQIFAGTGSALLPFLSLGAVGGIMALANFAALPLKKLSEAFYAGEIIEARKIQLSLAEINTAVTTRFGIPGLKYAMDQAGFYGGLPRRPLPPPSMETCKVIDTLLAGLKLE